MGATMYTIANDVSWIEVAMEGLNRLEVDDLHTANPETRALFAGILHECRELKPIVDEFMSLLKEEIAYASSGD